MKWVIQLIVSLVLGAIGKFIKKEPQTMEVGHSDGETEERLHDKIDDTWDKPSDSK
jgi:hypothetical protein